MGKRLTKKAPPQESETPVPAAPSFIPQGKDPFKPIFSTFNEEKGLFEQMDTLSVPGGIVLRHLAAAGNSMASSMTFVPRAQIVEDGEGNRIIM